MTFADVITAMIILGLFFFGLSQAFMPAYNAWEKASAEYNTAKTIQFIAESFRRECGKPDRNIENWKKNVTVAKELEAYEISELKQGEIVKALKMVCVVSGQRIEIIGLCTP
jgi:hypothetical protein